MEYYIMLAVIIVLLIIILIKLFTSKGTGSNTDELNRTLAELRTETNSTLRDSFSVMGNMISQNQKASSESQSEKIDILDKHISEKQDMSQKALAESLSRLEERFKTFSLENEQKLDGIRSSVEKKLTYIQEDNNKKLDEMRKTVDEKLQQSLEDRMTKSFALVSERLEQVYKGLGEMQALAGGVGDLKKVLSNVKTRGILGEIQLGAILKEILSSEQYEENIALKKGSREVVEFAVKLPAGEDGAVYLPIDSKFPGDTYAALRDAQEQGDKELIDQCAKQLIATVKAEAKDISSKYINPPVTTDFAIMFLPFEGLYCEVVNRGLVEILQRDYKVNVAGPSTMAALLNSLQMGFKTLAVQKRSSEVWNVLGAVKTEFDKFAKVLADTQLRLDQANKDLDALVGVRTRQIQRKLSGVTALSDGKSAELLDVKDDII